MMVKRIMLITLVLLATILIGAVSASDVNDTGTAVEDTSQNDLSAVNEIAADNLKASEENMSLASNDYDEDLSAQTDTGVLGEGSAKYSDLAREISQQGNIKLTHKNYTYDEGETITVSEDNKVIDGNGAVIDMNGSTIRAFHVRASGVTIKNLTIKNVNYNGDGGAIYFTSSGTVTNCNFTDNSAYDGGAVYGGSVVNCSFVNNSATNQGGAIYHFSGSGGSVVNCSFVGNSAKNAGAVYLSSTGGSVVNCSFVGNSATNHGGAVYLHSSGCSVVNCSFVGNSARSRGIIYMSLDFSDNSNFKGLDILNCIFKNNVAEYGSAIYYNKKFSNFTIANSYFINCSSVQGTLYFSDEKNMLLNNCHFINCSSTNQGSAVYWGAGNDFIVKKCTFENCSSVNYLEFYNGASDYLIKNCNFDRVQTNVLYYNLYDIEIYNLTFSKGDDGILKVYLSYDDEPIANKCLKFILNDSHVINKTNSNGIAEFNVKNFLLESGKYNINVSFEGDDVSSPFSVNAFVFIKYDSVLNVNDSFFIKGNDCNLITNLSNSLGGLSNKKITISLNNKTYEGTTDSSGLFELNIKNDLADVGKYLVNVKFEGDEFNEPISKNVSVFIRYAPIMEVNDLSFVLDENTLLMVKLSNSDDLYNKNITFSIEGKTYSAKTDLNGVVSFPISDYLSDYGNYVIGINYGGDDSNWPVSDNVSVHVVRYFGNLTIVQVGKYYRDTNLTFRLVNSKTNESISDAPVTIILDNYLSKTLFTDSNGIVSLKVELPPGNYNVGANVSMPYVEVNQADLNFSVSKFIGQVEVTQNEEPRILTVKLFNRDNGDVFENFTATLRLEHDGTYSYFDVITGSGGVVNFTIQSGVGTYSVHAFVEGQYMEFTPCDLENVIVNNNINSRITFSNSLLQFNYLGSDSTYVIVDGGIVKKENITVNSNDAVIDFKNNVITVSGLNAGNYTLKVVSTPNSGYNSVTCTISINVYKINSTVGFNKPNIVFDYGKSSSNYVTVNGGNVSIENITVDGHSEAVIGFNYGEITVSNLSAGNYTLRVKTTPDSNHYSSEGTCSITVNKIQSVIDLTEQIDFDYEGKGCCIISVDGGNVDLDNIGVEGQNAIISLDGNNITISGLDAGNYTLHIKTTPDDNHISVEGTAKITVNRIDSVIEFNKQEIVYDYGKVGSVKASIYGGLIGEAHVVDHNEADIYFEDDVVFISNLKAGEYTLYVRSNPDKNHNSVFKTIDVVVNSIESKVGFSGNLTFDYGQSDSTFVFVDGGSVFLDNISVVDHPEAKITFNNNIITVSNLSAGNYTLRVVSTPDKDHVSCVGTALITVNKIYSTISFSGNMNFAYGMSGSAYVIVDGGRVGNVVVDNHPEANISVDNNLITVSRLPVGDYILRVTSVPDNNHLPVENTLQVTVIKADSKVIFENEIIFDYEGVGFTSLSVEGGSIDYENIYVYDHPEASWSVSKRVISVSNLTAGNYILCVGTIPDGNHNPVIGSINITVNKIDSKLSLPSSLTFAYLQSASTFVSVDGGIVSADSFEILGDTNAKITFSDNFVSVSNLGPGRYTLKVTSIPDVNHNPDVSFITVTVNKASLKIQPSSVKSFQVNKGVWKVRVLDSQNKPVSNIKVILKVYTGSKFKTVTVVTNGNGEASYNIKGLSKGTHRIVSSVSHHGYSANPVTSSINIIKPKALKFKLKKNNPTKKATLISFQILDKKTKKGVNGVKVKVKIYTGKKYKSFTLKSKKVGKVKGIIGFTTNDFSAGKHKVVIEPVSLKYSGSGKTTMMIKKSAKKYPKKTFKV